MKNKHKNYEVNPAKFKKYLKTQIMDMLEEEPGHFTRKNPFNSLLPKLSILATLLIIVFFANVIFPAAPDAYAFLRQAQEQYEQKRSEAGIIKTISEYKEAETIYLLSVLENTEKDTVQIKVENRTENKLVGEILIKEKKLYSKKDLQEEIKKGLQGDTNAAPLADALTKKLKVNALFFEEALKKEGLKYEGEVSKNDKKLIKLSDGYTELFFDAKTLAPYEFVAAKADKGQLPDEYKLIEESYEEAPQDVIAQSNSADDWQEIRFKPQENFHPTIQNIEGLVYQLEIYEERLRAADPNNPEEVANIIKELQNRINSIKESEGRQEVGREGENQRFAGENLNEEKAHILEFLQYANKEKGQNVTSLINQVKAAKTHEELERLGDTVSPQLQRIYQESPFAREFNEDQKRQRENPERRGDHREERGENQGENGGEEYREEHREESLEQLKTRIKMTFDEAQKSGIDIGPYYELVEKAKSMEELEALENKVPDEIKNFFNDRNKAYKPSNGDFHEEYRNENSRDEYREPERESINDESDEEGYKGSDEEYGKKVQQILDELGALREEGVQTEDLYRQLSNARSHEHLDKLIFDLSQL